MPELPADFVLPVDKPENPTSHDVVQQARRALGVRRIGHTGTLDPFASGLLLLCVGRATRLAEYLSGLDKTYEAVARLGQETDTLDRDGTVVAESERWQTVQPRHLDAVLSSFVGEVEQLPPAYSAKKVDGERAHRLARRGEEVELPPVAVHIRSLEVTSFDLPLIGFRVRCSSGTYVRSLARDLGVAIGVGAHLTGLRRTSVGSFDVGDALTVDELGSAARVAASAVDPLDALRHLTRVDVDAEGADNLSAGRSIPSDESVGPGPVAVAHDGRLLAVAESRGGRLKPRKVFTT